MLVQAGLCRTCSETTLLVFPRGGSYIRDPVSRTIYLVLFLISLQLFQCKVTIYNCWWCTLPLLFCIWFYLYFLTISVSKSRSHQETMSMKSVPPVTPFYIIKRVYMGVPKFLILDPKHRWGTHNLCFEQK